MSTPFVKPTQAMLGLPTERLAQLRAIASQRGVSAVEVVEHAIRSAIEAGEIDDDLPGLCTITPMDGQGMVLEIRGQVLPPLDRDQAHLLAALLNAAAGREALPDREFKVGSAFSFALGRGFKIYVGRHVRAVLLALVDSQTGETTFRTATTASLATDLARLLRKHAAEIAPPLFRVADDGSFVPSDFLMRLASRETAMPSVPAAQEARS